VGEKMTELIAIIGGTIAAIVVLWLVLFLGACFIGTIEWAATAIRAWVGHSARNGAPEGF
jgi:hypothetical protein